MRARLRLALALAVSACATPARPPEPVAAAPGPAVGTAPDAGTAAAEAADPNLWLEEITGEKPLAWVKEHNAKSSAELTGDPSFEALRKRLQASLDSKDKIPYPDKRGKWFYNFWRDDQHPKGLWRRVASLAEYEKTAPSWETVLDVDALAQAESQNWVWKGATCLYPKQERCLVSLSHGGADAVVVRELDVVKKAFVPGGFVVPETKAEVAWKDLDTLYVAADFGPDSFTTSGYPRMVKEWKRGTPLEAATLLHQAAKSSMNAGAFRRWDHGRAYDLVWDRVSFFAYEWFLRQGEQWVKIDAPASADLDTWNGQLLLHLRDDWTVASKTWPKDSFLAIDLDAFSKGSREFSVLFEPAPNRSFGEAALLKSAVIVSQLEDVRSQLFVWTRPGGKWTRAPVPTDGLATYAAWPVERFDSDQYWFTSEGFTEPTTLELGTVGKAREKLKSSPAFFDSKGLVVEQHFTTSKDGTRVPYFQISKKDLRLDGQNPTLLYGYGGFEISLLPEYDPLVGEAWLERGGVLVIANTRGGSEYGPRWHQAGLKTKRQNIYDDMIAVAEELISRQVTSPPKLGIHGRSNGGLLMGVMLTQRPDLFGAIVCGVPLLDMKRYHLMLAGASWVEEYGDPDNAEEWAALAKFSPYQNVKKGVKYPRTLFYTSTRDDRVHPGHARKMVARMEEQGHDVLYYENVEGGHAGAADNPQKAFMMALAYTFLARQLGLAH